MKKYDPEFCKEMSVPQRGIMSTFQCSNKPKKDGWCMVHHPDSIKKREEKSPWYLLGKAKEQIIV